MLRFLMGRNFWVGGFILQIFLLAVAVDLAPISAKADNSRNQIDLSTPQKIEDAFLRALKLIEAGQPKQAVFLLRQILARNPDLPRVRLELARAYFMTQSWSESRAEFVAVLSGDIPGPVKQSILRFINAIDARRGFDWSAAIGVSVSPESGRKYKTDTVILDFFGTELPFKVEREEKNVIGVTFVGSAEARRKLLDIGSGPTVVGFLSGAADIFEAEGSAADDYSIGASAGARFIWPQTTGVTAATASLRYKAGDVYEDLHGINSAVEYRTETGFAPFLSVSYSDVDVRKSTARDGGLYGVRSGFSKSVFGSAIVGASISLQRFDAEASYETYDAVALSLLGRADLGAGFGATTRANFRFSDYESNAPFFLEKRKEEQYSLDVELVKNDMFIMGLFSPFIQLGYTYNNSSIGIYTYNEARINLGIKTAF